MADTSDAGAIRTSGIVLSAIGCLAMVIITGWNALAEYPSLDSLVQISGTVVSGEVKTVSTRTSIEKWIVIDIDSDTAADRASERWVFPRYAEFLADQVTALQVGAKVRARASSEPKRLRWNKDPVRVIWSLSDDARELVPYAEVVEVEKAAQYQSPMAGLIMVGLGVFLILGSRMRLETSS